MKRNWFFYLVVMVCANLLATSCSKEDPASGTISVWRDALGTYAPGEFHKLTVNGEEEISEAKSVLLSSGTGESAKFTLTNIVPDAPTVVIDQVTIIPSENRSYTFSGETSLGEITISISGTLTEGEDSNTLELNVTRKVNSPLTGVWKLNFTQDGSAILFRIESTNEAFNALMVWLTPKLKEVLARSIKDITVSLGEDGRFDLQWTKTGQDTPIGMPEHIRDMVGIYYFAEDGKLYLAIEKSLLPLLKALQPEGIAIDVDALVDALTEDRGDFVALPILFKQNDNEVEFSLGKNLASLLAPILIPLVLEHLPADFPESISQIIEQLPEIINDSQTFDVGLRFNHS
ncbi:MAG: hypothetical protein LBD89_01675 [Tannerellaceae bacterium]|jgi:hypothetical protein|nr:hypothetical protein [Tannerellaceae bacterium]